MRLSLHPLGFRERVISALVLTGAATLLVAGLTLLPPLRHRLRADAAHTLRARAKALAPSFAALPPGQANAAPQLEALTERLHRQAGARVVIFVRGRVLIDTDSGRRAAPTSPELEPGANGVRVERRIEVGAQPARLVLVRESTVVAGVVDTVRRSLLEAALIGLLVSVLLGFLIARRLLRRIDALREATDDIAAGKSVALPQAQRADELGELARAFAQMQERLVRQEQARRTFVSTASHELRTPLASLTVMLELAAEDLEPGREWPERAREQVERARGQAARLTGLAEHLLNLSQLDAGVPLSPAETDLGALARAMAAEFEPRAERSGVRLRVQGAETALADRGAVVQIVRILLDNALRFAPPGTEVLIETAASEDGLCLAVSDRGSGVPVEEAELIFRRFARGRSSGGSAGFGLGLAIARELARRMGGRLELATQAPAGARFVLALPPTPPEAAQAGEEASPPARAARA